MKRLKILVSGKVHGVFFRYTTKQIAEQYNITGYAKNLPDGRVEIIVEGDENNTKLFLEWCNKGPEFGKVENIEIKELKGKKEFNEFSIH